jgi:DNA methylase
MLCAVRAFLGDNDMMAYLAMMAIRLIELHRVLKSTGSLYLHCDPTASHYLKILLDGIFSPKNFRSEIIWKRSSAHSDAKQGRKIHGHIHDVIFFYTNGTDWTWNDLYTPYDESYVGRDYRLKDEETGRQFRRGDLTAARPGGDTEYDWRVKRHENVAERWSADLDERPWPNLMNLAFITPSLRAHHHHSQRQERRAKHLSRIKTPGARPALPYLPFQDHPAP